MSRPRSLLVMTLLGGTVAAASAQARPAAKLDQFKQEVARQIDARSHFTAQMVDQIFSFGELGFQETETSRYLVKLLTDSGFTVQTGFAGIPTSFIASWGSGKPVISLGTDIDDIPQASQWPASPATAP